MLNLLKVIWRQRKRQGKPNEFLPNETSLFDDCKMCTTFGVYGMRINSDFSDEHPIDRSSVSPYWQTLPSIYCILLQARYDNVQHEIIWWHVVCVIWTNKPLLGFPCTEDSTAKEVPPPNHRLLVLQQQERKMRSQKCHPSSRGHCLSH